MKLYEKRTARFTVGTTQAGWTAGDVDYLCTGTNDHVQINNALNALPADGGEVIILDGIYNIEGTIRVAKDNTTLRGNGNATILKRMYNSDATYTSNTARGLITLDNKKGCGIKNLYIDGNKNDFDSVYNCGILTVSSSDNAISNNTCGNDNYGIYLFFSNNNTITNNICDNSNYGIYLSSYSNNNIATGNTCNNNNNGIRLFFSSNSNTVTGNICNNNNEHGIYLYSSNNNTITNNICDNNRIGIDLSFSSNNIISNNTCNNNSSYGIRLTSSCRYNCIVVNLLIDNGTAYSGRGIGNIAANNVKKINVLKI